MLLNSLKGMIFFLNRILRVPTCVMEFLMLLVPVLEPVFLQINVNQCNILLFINCKLNWYKQI